ncbi:MAG: hypothetical protein JSV94_00975 [Methanobacteriota archaeon]|nr:MAG: hypothetical protein JSV94_00975 [Euryarchaeota archaeon]
MNASEKNQPGTASPPIDLAEYGRAYLRSYVVAVESESPEHVPSFYRNRPYSIEICRMPNSCFCMLFERSDRPSIAVSNNDWGYVMARLMSGVSYVATVYSYEGVSVDDAAARGRRDAIRDICALEASGVVDSAKELEKLVEELKNTAKWSKNPTKTAEYAVSRLESIRQNVLRSGPSVDTMAMIESVKRYPPVPVQVTLDSDGMKTLVEVADRLESLDEAIQLAKTQESQVEAIEGELHREIRSFKSELDKKMAKGLGVILTTTDRKVDKAVESCSRQEAEIRKLREAMSSLPAEVQDAPIDPRVDDLSDEIEILKSALDDIKASIAESANSTIEPVPQVQVVGDVAGLKQSLENVSGRVKRIEDYLVAVSRARKAR